MRKNGYEVMPGSEFEVSLNVALVAEITEYPSRDYDLLLVRNRETQKWGLVAGHVEKGETAQEALVREIKQETEICSGSISLWLSDYLNFVLIPRGEKTTVGLIYYTRFSKNDLPDPVSWPVTDEDIDLARVFSFDEVFDMIENSQEFIHRPNLNLPQIVRWLTMQYKRGRADNETRQRMALRFDRLVESGAIPDLFWQLSSSGEKDEPEIAGGKEFIDLNASWVNLAD